nr:MAG TPA: hypothetical protein [Caudoviricetes sp.]
MLSQHQCPFEVRYLQDLLYPIYLYLLRLH